MDDILAEIDNASSPDQLKDFFDLTDVGNAGRLVKLHGEDLRFVPEWGWMVFDGKIWRRDDLKSRELMVKTALAIYREAENKTDPEAQKTICKWARASQNANRISSALWLAQAKLPAKTSDFDNENYLLPVVNGVIDLRTGDLFPHRRDYFLTKLAPCFYRKDATAPVWEKFLRRVIPDESTRHFLQRAVGYCLTGLTVEQVLFFLYGNGRNGKSVFIDALEKILGDFHAATRIDTLAISRGGGIPNDVAALAGARMVTVSETPENVRVNEPLIKDLTGGDTISARFLRHEFFQFKPQFKLWIRGNHKPQIRGTDDGIWRRLLLVPFTVQIPHGEVDPRLPEKLEDELPGILAWAVQGCIDWQSTGLMPPEVVTAAVKNYREEMDVLGEFIAARCVVLPEATVGATPLYREYCTWCEESGERSLSQKRFGTALGERGFIKSTPKTVIWSGIAIKTRPSDHCDHPSISSQSRARDTGEPETRSQWSEPSEFSKNWEAEV